ncbi:hypothetical protein [Paenarthrobacter sp. A20]|uniref:hypothetical protein n=1 Tax=Paenarthrobacter sp. A20 TaxID=2817891 RepID=UPI00209F05E8|nr:hypothetical protein [Paenarthrobacter sp. A20]MCP1413680.1 hypothetical protein [Paenarthrobacter sp. A20]
MGVITGTLTLVGSLGAQFVVAWKENNRLKSQNQREDELQRKTELLQIYTKLLGELDKYVVAVTKHKGGQVHYQSLAALADETPGRNELLGQLEDYADEMSTLATEITGQLRVIELLEETDVYSEAVAYFSAVKDLDVKSPSTVAQAGQIHQRMTEAMKTSLKGKPVVLPSGAANNRIATH